MSEGQFKEVMQQGTSSQIILCLPYSHGSHSLLTHVEVDVLKSTFLLVQQLEHLMSSKSSCCCNRGLRGPEDLSKNNFHHCRKKAPLPVCMSSPTSLMILKVHLPQKFFSFEPSKQIRSRSQGKLPRRNRCGQRHHPPA